MTAPIQPPPWPCQRRAEPHRWIQTARYVCRDCGHADVCYWRQERFYSGPHPSAIIPAAHCMGLHVRQLTCAYCGLTTDILYAVHH